MEIQKLRNRHGSKFTKLHVKKKVPPGVIRTEDNRTYFNEIEIKKITEDVLQYTIVFYTNSDAL